MENNNMLTSRFFDSSYRPSLKNSKMYILCCITLFILWAIFCWKGLSTAVAIWYGNEIFNHCFFIIPASGYLIYLKRKSIFARRLKPSLLSLVTIIPAILLYIVGLAGDVKLFMHAGTFVLLPSLIWLVLGTEASKTILFPLVFILFSIPVGEQLIPVLQEVAADGSVWLLQVTDIPLFRHGLYIEIPQGRFLVAEACSGVSFFIASFVIGSLYAYLNLKSANRSFLFVAISLIFPVLANIVRVYGIILIAYWTDMEYAAGADHLIYGWFFFAFVIVVLLAIGELFRKYEGKQQEQETEKVIISNISVNGVANIVAVCGILTLAIFWSHMISERAFKSYPVNSSTSKGYSEDIGSECFDVMGWSPVLSKPDYVKVTQSHQSSGCNAIYVEAHFSGTGNELVSGLHRLYDPEGWSREYDEVVEVMIGEESLSLNALKITSLSGKQIYVVRWYTINDRVFTRDINAKLYQIMQVLSGEPTAGSMVIYATQSKSSLDSLNLREPI